MAGVSRKLKRKPGFHGRLFVEKEFAEMWITRMGRKMGEGWKFGIDPWSDEGGTGYVAYMHKEEE